MDGQLFLFAYITQGITILPFHCESLFCREPASHASLKEMPILDRLLVATICIHTLHLKRKDGRSPTVTKMMKAELKSC